MEKKLHSNFSIRENEPKGFYGNGFVKNLIFQNKPRLKAVSLNDRKRIVLEGQSSNISIESLCFREGISQKLFQNWTNDFLMKENSLLNFENNEPTVLNDDDRFKIVIEGKSGETSIPEICKRENITQDLFLQWCNEFFKYRNNRLTRERKKDDHAIRVNHLFETTSSKFVLNYLESFLDVTRDDTYVSPDVNDKLELGFKNLNIKNFVCLQKINDIRYINKHFELVNSKLEKNGIFVGCLETFQARKSRLKVSNLLLINNIYFLFEFLLNRVLPKLSFTKRYYFDFTKGNDRLLSKAEGLGRLVSCGFKIMDYKSIDGLVYFVVKKEKEPVFDLNPSYGPIYAMPRLGKNGKMFNVYKFRTMHPYSEYLQDYVLKVNGYSESGKPASDFRIPIWGRFMRRLWLDEIPQLINVFKGEMKLVGIRPVSLRYFQDIPKEMQNLRQTQKPGCIPPYVALNREGNVMSVLQSEKDYLEEKIKSPYFTDLKYLLSAIYNIVFKHKRSA